MNKQKGIIIGVLALAVTMMVGYALFSETITINGTATAKGSFDIGFDCELMTENLLLDNYSKTEFLGTTGGTGTCTIEGNTIKTTSTLNKPTDLVTYKVTLTNNGTIPAVLKTVDSSNNVAEDYTKAGDYAYFDKTTMLLAEHKIIFNNTEIIEEGDTAAEQAKITIQPSQTITLIVGHSLTDASLFGIEQPKLPEAGATMNYNITLGFEQVTVN